MGRHSAPDDEDDLVEGDSGSAVQVAVVDRDISREPVPFRPGRHARSGAPEDRGPGDATDADEPVPADVEAGGVAPLALPSDATVRIAKVEVEAGRNDLLDTDPGTGDLDLVAQIAALDPAAEPALTRPLPDPPIALDSGDDALIADAGLDPAVFAPEAVPVGAEAAPAAAASPVSGVASADRSSKGDLALVRRHTDVLARCLAGVLVPIAVYVVVLAVVGSFGARTLLIWIWIPLISAGVLLGLFLDAGHKRYDARDHARAAVEAAPAESPPQGAEPVDAPVDD